MQPSLSICLFNLDRWTLRIKALTAASNMAAPLIILDPIYLGASDGQPEYNANVQIKAPKLATEDTIPVADATATGSSFELAVHAILYTQCQRQIGEYTN